ncbi:MAG: hypothetical protein CMO16_06770 [Thaumarchaeota archaeon]|nr:hypothetical protein [Nitrososphaerota archaeon]
MRTVSSKVSNREHAAIVKYANQAGKSVSNLIRRVVISDAVYGDSFGEIPAEYHVNRYPADIEEEAGDEVLEVQIKEIKVSLGWEEEEKRTLAGYAAWLRKQDAIATEKKEEPSD